MNYIADLLEERANLLRKGGHYIGHDFSVHQKILSDATVFIGQRDVSHDAAIEFAEAIKQTGRVPKDIDAAFSALTGWKFPKDGLQSGTTVRVA